MLSLLRCAERLVMVPVLEAGNEARIGRFGWKSQHASLESFSADAYLNEMGITSPLFPDENTSSGRFVGFGSPFDPVEDPEDDGVDVVAFANFIRSTKAPPRGLVTRTFRQGKCCSIRWAAYRVMSRPCSTARPGTRINGDVFTVPDALGDKIIHPYSDFLLHNVGTGDGIPVSPAPEHAATTNMMRTAPFWGLRTRNRLMHDGLSFTKQEAIERHGGQAAAARASYNALTDEQQGQVIEFLNSSSGLGLRAALIDFSNRNEASLPDPGLRTLHRRSFPLGVRGSAATRRNRAGTL